MDDIGFILTTYVVAFAATVALAWHTVKRGRALSQQLPDEDKPWT